jgi:hypothetical protein
VCHQQEASWLQPFRMRKVSFLLCRLFIGVACHFIEYRSYYFQYVTCT